MLNQPFARLIQECENTQYGTQRSECKKLHPEDYEYLVSLRFHEALAYFRLKNYEQAEKSLALAPETKRWEPRLLYFINIDRQHPNSPLVEPLEKVLPYVVAKVPPAEMEDYHRLRRSLIYGHTLTRTPQMVYSEYLWTIIYLAAALILSAGLIYVARRPLWRGLAALGRHREKQSENNEKTAPVPIIYDWRYPNRAYKLASYFNGALWLLLALPLIVLAAIPVVAVFRDFSPWGLQQAVVNIKNFAATFPEWGRPWFALVLLALTGFVVLKIFGRYSLPKPMRPKVRVFHTSVRLVLLAAFLGIVGTGLVFISSTFSSIANNSIVKVILAWL